MQIQRGSSSHINALLLCNKMIPKLKNHSSELPGYGLEKDKVALLMSACRKWSQNRRRGHAAARPRPSFPFPQNGPPSHRGGGEMGVAGRPVLNPGPPGPQG